jgi:hypothetical protein
MRFISSNTIFIIFIAITILMIVFYWIVSFIWNEEKLNSFKKILAPMVLICGITSGVLSYINGKIPAIPILLIIQWVYLKFKK